MATLIELAEKIIEEKGGDEFRMAWLKEYLSDPARMDDFMAELLKKQLADSVKNNGKKGTPPPPPIK